MDADIRPVVITAMVAPPSPQSVGVPTRHTIKISGCIAGVVINPDARYEVTYPE